MSDSHFDHAQLSLERMEWIQALARRLCSDAGLADDAAQETALLYMRKRPSEDVSLSGWLHRALLNRLRQGQRAALRSEARERAAARPEQIPSAADLVLKASLQREVVDAVLTLEEPYRETVLLRYFEDLSPTKIAKRQGVPVDTVKTRLKRSLARLREKLDERHGGDGRSWGIALLTHVVPRKSGLAAAAASTGPIFMTLNALSFKNLTIVSAVLMAFGLWWVNQSAMTHVEADTGIAGTEQAELEGLDEDTENVVMDGIGDDGARRVTTPVLDGKPAAAAAPSPSNSSLKIDVTVVDLESHPVVGVEVCVRLADDSKSSVDAIGTTNAGGRLTIETERKNAFLYVTEAPWTTVIEGTVQAFGQTSTPTVVVARARSIGGRVVSSDGVGVPGAKVTFTSDQTPWLTMERVIDHVGRITLETTTDEAGGFAFPRAPEMQDVRIDVTDSGTRRVSVDVESQGAQFLEVVLEDAAFQARPPHVVGRVVYADGAPANGAQVSFGSVAQQTGQDGEFGIDFGHELDGTTLRAIMPGYLPAEKVVPESGIWPTPLVLTLGAKALRIRARIVNEENKPVESVRVHLRGQTTFGFATAGKGASAVVMVTSVEAAIGDATKGLKRVSAKDGWIEFDGLLARSYTLIATDPRTMEAAVLMDVPAGTSDAVIVIPTPAQTVLVKGHVVGTDGVAISGVSLMLQRHVDGSRMGLEGSFQVQCEPTMSDSDGAFQFTAVGSGDLTLQAFAGPDRPRVSIDLSTLSDLEDVVVTMPRQASFFIELSQAEGYADSFHVEDASGEIVPLAQSSGQMSFTMRQGFFSEGRSPVFSVPEGKHMLILELGGDEVGREEIEMSPGESAQRVRF